ncbi:hypothetical protein TRIP_D410126 [uncultured Paludibacter sp.]|nr:hypothetical protein TRIP_D410126 [uncultured Paludibacter sp.]
MNISEYLLLNSKLLVKYTIKYNDINNLYKKGNEKNFGIRF